MNPALVEQHKRNDYPVLNRTGLAPPNSTFRLTIAGRFIFVAVVPEISSRVDEKVPGDGVAGVGVTLTGHPCGYLRPLGLVYKRPTSDWE